MPRLQNYFMSAISHPPSPVHWIAATSREMVFWYKLTQAIYQDI